MRPASVQKEAEMSMETNLRAGRARVYEALFDTCDRFHAAATPQ